MFYNTVKETGSRVRHSYEEAKNQDDKVLLFFIHNRDDRFSPEQVWRTVFDTEKVPLTSIRRSITTLTNKRLLEKTPFTCMGNYNKEVGMWRLV